ncbi:MAG: hypothetical protein EOP84_23175, partial [Verrucomicrobiaceae bacterium]
MDASWEYELAHRFSPRLTSIENESAAVAAELPQLPVVPVADQGGTGGFASLHPASSPATTGEFAVVLSFPAKKPVDLVALVPARRYGVQGLESQFGMPDGFTVELLDAGGAVVRTVVTENGLWSDPVRAGHPFVYQVEPPVEAAGLRISASQLRLDSDVSDSYVHAWAEAFAFSGEFNAAYGSKVTSVGGSSPAAPWQWANSFLVDGQTPLGLPEVPAGQHMNVGWMSEGKPKASDPVWVELDLGQEREFDSIRLFPAKRPTSDLPSGFGFPRRFTVSIPQSSGEPVRKSVEMTNPGHNPVLVPLERCRGR